MPHIIPSIYNVSEFEDATVEQIVHVLRHDYLELIQKIRNAAPDQQKRMKTGLPAFTLGTFRDRIDNDNFISTEYLIYDVDGLNTTQLMSMKNRAREFAAFVFETPRGKGLKFVIQMETPLDSSNYDANYLHYQDYFADTLGIPVDRAYRSKHTFFSHDAECKLLTPTLFPVITPAIVTKVLDVDTEVDLKAELMDVCSFIGTKCKDAPLNYSEWLTLTLGLKHLGDTGKEYYLMIGRQDTLPEHAHRDWNRKWEEVGTPKNISVASVYWLAYRRGYERKEQFVKEGYGKKNPFIVRKDGMYYQAKKNEYPARIFGFKDIRILYTVIDKINGNKVLCKVDGHEITIPQRALSSAQSFREVILKNKPGLTYMSLSVNVAYDILLNYMDRTQRGVTVYYAPGIGNVARDLWNLGNVVISNGRILPYESIIYTEEEKGYLLDDVQEHIYAEASKEFFKKMLKLFEFYGEKAAIAIGWAYANIYYQKILSKCGGFPILFLHGRTKSGKSQLAHLILSMFGVKNPENSSDFKLSMEKATANAMGRVKDKAWGIPTLFDEYGANWKHNDEHYVTLKSLFDASGKTTAKFSNDNQTKKLNVRSGSIFTACNKESREEGVNRCVYLNMDGVSDSKDSKEFERLYQGLGRRDMGAFLPFAIIRSSYQDWAKAYDEAYEKVRHIKCGSRVHANYAIVMAGYEVVKQMLVKQIKLPEIAEDWWVFQVKQTGEYIADSNPAQIIVDHLSIMAGDSDKFRWMQVRETDIGGEEQGTEVSFILKSAIIDIRRNYRIEGLPSEADLKVRLREHPYYVRSCPKYMPGIGTKYVITLKFPAEGYGYEEKIQQPDIPF